jgi:hypothetical protein
MAGLPAAAQNIPAGDDVWNTPGGGGTYFTMPGSDLDTVCGIRGHGDTVIVLTGKNLPGQGDGDIVIRRLSDAVFPAGSGGSTQVGIQAKSLSFASASTVSTLCGNLKFTVSLDGGQANQPTTWMTITRDDKLGGTFNAAIMLNVRFDATNSAGNPVGPPLHYSPTLPDPGGTPWAYHPPANPLNPNAAWFPGVTKAGQPVTVNRFYDPAMGIPASHQYQPPKPLPPPCRHVDPADPVGHVDPAEPGGSTEALAHAQAAIAICAPAADNE